MWFTNKQRANKWAADRIGAGYRVSMRRVPSVRRQGAFDYYVHW